MYTTAASILSIKEIFISTNRSAVHYKRSSFRNKYTSSRDTDSACDISSAYLDT